MIGEMNFIIILALVSVASADLNASNRHETTTESSGLEESLSSQERNFIVSIGSDEDSDDEAALRIAERACSAAE